MAASPAEIEKRLKNIKKKLGQIEKLKEKDASELDAEQQEKVSSEASLLAEVEELQAQLKGGGYPASTPAPAAPAAKQEAPPAEPAKPKKAAAAAPKVAEKPAKAPAEPEPAAAAEPLSAFEADKRIKNIKKKLGQIAKLKEKKASDLDADAREKLASEAELLREMACLEAGEVYVPPATGAGEAIAAAAEAAESAEPAVIEDPHAVARAQALEAPPGDLGLLLDDETEKRFRSLQKKLRDIGSLRKKDKLDKLQTEKLTQEPALIEEITAIREKANEMVAKRRELMAAKPKKTEAEPAAASKPKPKSADRPEWMCNECGAYGKVSHLIGSDGALACNKCGSTSLTHYGPGQESESEDDGAEAEVQEKQKKHVSADLKTARQKKQPVSKKQEDTSIPKPSAASWPEVKEVLESGDGGDDKGRQKKTIEVRRAKDGPPYDKFDQTLLRCSFLTRVEMKLAPGVLTGEDFNMYFPGGLADGLVELVLKENQLPMVPPGIAQLQRLRVLDLANNKIESLPDEETFESVCGTLEMLDLSFNKLTSIAELGGLKKLSQLKVDANQLTSLEGVSWGDLKQITTLSAVGNQIAELSQDVAEAPSLEYVELSENKLTTLPQGVCELKKLKAFNISGNPIKDPKLMKAAEKGTKDLKTYLEKVCGGGKRKK